jgi:hypothetical protein
MFWGTITHYEVRLNVEIITVFRADKMPQIHDIMFVLFYFGRKLNRTDSKNGVMTLTRKQTKMYLIFSNFLISKDIVWAYGFKMHVMYELLVEKCNYRYMGQMMLNNTVLYIVCNN